MNSTNSSKSAAEQLTRVLDFFSRVESKASALLAINIGMLGLSAINTKPADFTSAHVALLGIAQLIGLVSSIVLLYLSITPHLKGGTNSLIYFFEIPRLTEETYVDRFIKCGEEELTKEVLKQVWQNSLILKTKFERVKFAFLFTTLSVPIWILYLISVGLLHSNLIIK